MCGLNRYLIQLVILDIVPLFSIDFSILDPKNFQDTDQTISHKAFKRLSDLIMRFDSDATANSLSQVASERSFSKLKTIKTRLRNSLSQDNLEACMMMSVEKDMLMKANNGEVKNVLGSSNVTM
ncbi:uncharacterized protein LOC111028594 [Myzus persicae]|uniref:uncharacterized protein LOC111028594 n=1 Tax=Myzus persicae TaxID=13164 RepID=UPI000B931FBE|nr:uncharacterized protein LOC111028594 [Myzus persicae]